MLQTCVIIVEALAKFVSASLSRQVDEVHFYYF